MSDQAEIWTFPTNPEEFEHDSRISFSRLERKYIAVQDDGTEYEFDSALKRWVPMIDEALIEEHQSAYAAPHADDGSSSSRQQDPAQGRKRKNDQANDREDSTGRPKNRKKQATRQNQQPRQNTAVYVTNLPLDATVDEIHELFSRKCGVIAEEIDSGRPRIKLYTNADGNFKGDALVVFFKPQSVAMAIMLLDDTEFRFSPSGTASTKIRVQEADLSYKKTNYDDGGGGEAGSSSSTAGQGNAQPAAGDGGDKNGKAAAGGKRANDQEKKKIIKKTQKLDAKLADWDDDGPSTLHPDPKGSKWEKVVILSHMFSLEELEEDPTAILDIKEDIREECEKLGPVTNVVLFDLEEEGIVSVKFQTQEGADACLELMHGRSFGGRTVEAYFATGKERFRKSKNKDNDADNDSD